jgi:hypothetical protein
LRLWKVTRICRACLALTSLLLPIRANAASQTQQSGPVDTLRDVLMAACSHDSQKFAANLTARNSSAFIRMTPAAQTSLLRRFVLLNDPGIARAENAEGGNLTVFCVTPQLTSQMEIAKPEVRDNLAYLPLLVKDATDSADSSSKRVIMGLVREDGQWKLLSLGVLLLDLPTLAEEWDKAEIQTNEKSAVAFLKELIAAIEKYRVTYTHLPQNLSDLGPPAKGAPKGEQAGLVEAGLAAGRKDGYAFRYVIVGANDSGAPAKYQLAAIPIAYGRTGTRSFFRDESGIIHGADHQGAVGTQLDPKVE